MVATPTDRLTQIDHPPKMSYEEFLTWAGDDIRAEWVDGEVIVFMAVGRRHVFLISFLFGLLKTYVGLRRLGEVFGEPFEQWTRGGKAVRRPDAVFVATERLARFTKSGFEGAVDLAVEVVSDDSPNRDRREKMEEYAAAGVPEYWIVEGREHLRGVEFYKLGPDGTYLEIPANADGRLWSKVLPGFWLDPTWLDGDPLPNVFAVMSLIATDASAEFQALARLASGESAGSREPE